MSRKSLLGMGQGGSIASSSPHTPLLAQTGTEQGKEQRSIDGCRSLPHHEESQRRFAPIAITIIPER